MIAFSLERSLEILGRTPAVLESALAGLGDPWIRNDEGPETWSPFDVVGHLIHGERADWIPRARIILEYGAARAFEPFDRFAQSRESRGKTLKQLLEDFAELRKANLAELSAWRLTETDLDREGLHPDLGRVTLRQLFATWVVHDLEHLAQAARVMARQYAPEVGPWSAYLPILRR